MTLFISQSMRGSVIMSLYRDLLIKIGTQYENLLEIAFKEDTSPTFCAPLNTMIFARSSYSDYYCRIKEFGDMIFMMEFHPQDGHHVHPLAENLEDFMRLLYAVHRIAVLSDVPYQTADNIYSRIEKIIRDESKESSAAFRMLEEMFPYTPMENPYDYVKNLNEHFDFSRIRYPDEYYEMFEIPNPWVSQKPDRELVHFSKIFEGTSFIEVKRSSQRSARNKQDK